MILSRIQISILHMAGNVPGGIRANSGSDDIKAIIRIGLVRVEGSPPKEKIIITESGKEYLNPPKTP